MMFDPGNMPICDHCRSHIFFNSEPCYSECRDAGDCDQNERYLRMGVWMDALAGAIAKRKVNSLGPWSTDEREERREAAEVNADWLADMFEGLFGKTEREAFLRECRVLGSKAAAA